MGRRIFKAVAAAALLSGLGVVGSGIAGATTPACSPTAGAASCTESATASITAGTLTVEAPATLSWADQLNGVNQVVDDSFPVSVVDATGSGHGWNTTITMTTLTDSSTSKTLPKTAVRLNGSSSTAAAVSAPAPACGATSTCTVATLTPAVAYPFTVPATTTAPPATAFSDAKATSGMGTIKLPFDAWLHVPANAYAGTYTSTITVSVVSGP